MKHPILLILLILSCCLLPAQQSGDSFNLLSLADPQANIKAYNHGVVLLADGKYDIALHGFNAMLREVPHHKGALLNKAICEYKLERYSDAISALDKLIEHGLNATYFYIRGLCHTRLGNEREAESDLSRCLSIDLNFSQAYYARALVRLEGHDQRGAVRDLLEFTAMEPGQANGWYDLALLYFYSGQNEKALVPAQNSVSADPDSPEYAYLLALVLKRTGNILMAKEILTEVHYNHPGFLPAQNELALVYVEEGMLIECSRLLGLLTESQEVLPVYESNYGCILFQMEKYHSAVPYFTRAINTSPTTAAYWFNRACALEMTHDRNDACEDWQIASRLGMEEAGRIVERQCK